MPENDRLSVLVVGVEDGEITLLDRLIAGLASQGVRVTLAAPRKETANRFHSENVRWLWAPRWSEPSPMRLVNATVLWVRQLFSARSGWLRGVVAAQAGARSKLQEFYKMAPFVRGDWDVIYFPWNGAAISYEALYRLGMPVVVSCLGSQVNIRTQLPDSGEYVSRLGQSLQEAARVHCVSQDILEEATHYGLEREKAVVIRPAVDPRYFTPVAEPSHNARLRLITTGSLIWRKGYEYALMAFKQLLDGGVDAEFHIIGSGPERQRVLFTTHDLGLEGRVILHGSLAPDAVLAELQKSDIFILSSLSEGISNAVLEAMSCGLPVVTTDCGGMREAVADGVEGFVVPVRAPQAMAEALAHLAGDADLRRSMGAAGRARVIREFNAKDQVAAYIQLFSDNLKPAIPGGLPRHP